MITRRQFLKRAWRGSLYTLLTTGIGYYYARYIEPKLLGISKHTVRSPLIPKSFAGIKIVQFSDLHLGYHYSIGQLRRVVDTINAQSPDVVFFTGDLMDDQRSFGSTEEIWQLLKRIQAPLGKYCIYGNHDHGGYGTELYKTLMTRADFRLLQNEEARIRLLDGSEIAVLGLDDMMLGHPEPEKTAQLAHPDVFTILLAHEPDVAPRIADYPVNLQLSGHSHGGQVKLPFFGPVITPPLARIYTEGFYTITGAYKLTLFVSRGLGMTRVPFRFLSRPEIVVFTMHRE
ncbi:metallophosphoesterase [Ectobacillus ponti]|uniref:Metallophosphoesterase n=1 Tax=Ectobacillus ponti TaxID=2961894 RepID=A0AA41X8R8_9BACI|nr:metallophosphoesterase [Ectobacillus ponti]MCP8970877.1 metallophosphoesterase [Ectobacillus ponti]